MRKTHKQIADAFKAERHTRTHNAEAHSDSVYLHGNRIAQRTNGIVYVGLHGWNTVTTRGLVNAIMQTLGGREYFCQRDFMPCIYNVDTQEWRPASSRRAYALDDDGTLIETDWEI